MLVARGLIHGVAAACFWDTGQDNKDFRFSNYINRFHDRHTDLMDVLAISGGRIYVDGLLCELEPAAVAVTLDPAQAKQATVSALIVDGYAFSKGQWVELAADDVAGKKLLRVESVDVDQKTLTFDDDVSAYQGSKNPVVRRVVTYLSQPDLPAPPFSVQPGGDPEAVAELQPSSKFSLAYLHVWERRKSSGITIRIPTPPSFSRVALRKPAIRVAMKTNSKRRPSRIALWMVLRMIRNGAAKASTGTEASACTLTPELSCLTRTVSWTIASSPSIVARP